MEPYEKHALCPYGRNDVHMIEDSESRCSDFYQSRSSAVSRKFHADRIPEFVVHAPATLSLLRYLVEHSCGVCDSCGARLWLSSSSPRRLEHPIQALRAFGSIPGSHGFNIFRTPKTKSESFERALIVKIVGQTHLPDNINDQSLSEPRLRGIDCRASMAEH